MSGQSNADLILSLYDEFRRGDIAAVMSHLDPQAELVFEGSSDIPWSGNRHGHDGWAQFFQTLSEHLDEITLLLEPFAVQGDHLVVAGRYQARVKRNGKRIDSPLVHLWTLRNGLVMRCQEMTNTAAEVAACLAGAAAGR